MIKVFARTAAINVHWPMCPKRSAGTIYMDFVQKDQNAKIPTRNCSLSRINPFWRAWIRGSILYSAIAARKSDIKRPAVIISRSCPKFWRFIASNAKASTCRINVHIVNKVKIDEWTFKWKSLFFLKFLFFFKFNFLLKFPQIS